MIEFKDDIVKFGYDLYELTDDVHTLKDGNIRTVWYEFDEKKVDSYDMAYIYRNLFGIEPDAENEYVNMGFQIEYDESKLPKRKDYDNERDYRTALSVFIGDEVTLNIYPYNSYSYSIYGREEVMEFESVRIFLEVLEDVEDYKPEKPHYVSSQPKCEDNITKILVNMYNPPEDFARAIYREFPYGNPYKVENEITVCKENDEYWVNSDTTIYKSDCEYDTLEYNYPKDIKDDIIKYAKDCLNHDYSSEENDEKDMEYDK